MDGSSVDLAVDPNSSRIQLIKPFGAWDGKGEQDLTMLIKVRGKCSECNLLLNSANPGSLTLLDLVE